MAVAVAAQDPLTTLVQRWGEAVAQARHRTDLLADSLRELETIDQQLLEYGVRMYADLGPIGDHARSAFVTVAEHREAHDRDTFQLPREASG